MSALYISGGTVIDPEKMTRYPADVLCRNGKLSAILPPDSPVPEGCDVLSAKNMFVCPGFIDPHAHLDGCIHTGNLCLLQGITTSLGGNCGFSPLPIGPFLDSQTTFPIHQAELVGLSALREAAGAYDPFEPTTPEQVHRMEALCEQALKEGAAGVSLGPGYTPGSTMEEMEALCQLAHDYGRVAAIDTRMYSMTDLHSLEEAIELAESSGCRMIISHFEYQYGVGVEEEALHMLSLARLRGIDMALDSGMYKDWSSFIGSALFEPVGMKENDINLHNLRVITGPHIGEVPDQALYEHLRACHPKDSFAVFTGSEEAVYTIQRYPLTMVSTDAGSYHDGEGHPQIAGSFPRYLKKMVIERKELTWEQAIFHTTLLPARTIGLAGKGRMTPGCDADLIVFDPKTICDRADFPGLGQPNATSAGIHAVIVSGQTAVLDGKMTGVMAGKIIRTFDPIRDALSL